MDKAMCSSSGKIEIRWPRELADEEQELTRTALMEDLARSMDILKMF